MNEEEWPKCLKEIFRMLKPGDGWIQACEYSDEPVCSDRTVPPDAAIFRVPIFLVPADKKFFELLKEFQKRMHFKSDGGHLELSLIEAGFTDIKIVTKELDIGCWKQG